MILVLKWSEMNDEERALSQFVQGILNRGGGEVFIDVDNYTDYIGNDYVCTSVWKLIEENAAKFTGAVVFDLNFNNDGLNMAATVSAAHDILGVPRGLIQRVNSLGIKTLYDLKNIEGSRAQRQRAVFNAVKDKLNKTAVVHQVIKEGNFHLTLRDFCIANRWVCFYTGESDEDRAFRREVLGWLNPNVPVYGWNDDEIAFIRDISEYGDYAVPTDWSCNHSYFGHNIYSVKQNVKRTAVAENKHYVALVVSDGDNVQWLERDFAAGGTFGQRQRSSYDYKLNWTFSPSLARLCPQAAERIYATAKKDYFISGVSGVGYANCLSYPREHLDAFTRLTSEAMKESDLDVVCLLDNIELTRDKEFTADRLSSYAVYDNIKGGIWELDPDRYGSGKGKIFRACGKPFVSVRFTMWHPSGEMQNVTREWLDGIAEEVNAMPVNPFGEEGYTVVNVHPWTVNMQALDYFVSRLAGHIELVYADELIDLINKNVGKV